MEQYQPNSKKEILIAVGIIFLIVGGLLFFAIKNGYLNECKPCAEYYHDQLQERGLLPK